MKTYERLKNMVTDQSSYISFYKDYIYILNYQEILKFNSEDFKIRIDNGILNIYGNNFMIIRKSKLELEIKGSLVKMEIRNE